MLVFLQLALSRFVFFGMAFITATAFDLVVLHAVTGLAHVVTAFTEHLVGLGHTDLLATLQGNFDIELRNRVQVDRDGDLVGTGTRIRNDYKQ